MPLFFLTLTCSSLPGVASIFTVELCVIFLALSRISFHDSNNFVIYSDSRSALQALWSLYTRSPLVLKIQRFLFDLHAFENLYSAVVLSGNEKADVLHKRAIQLPPANHNALPLRLRSLYSLFHQCLLAVPLKPACCEWQYVGSVETFPWSMDFLFPAVSPLGSFLVPSPYRSYSSYTRSFDGS